MRNRITTRGRGLLLTVIMIMEMIKTRRNENSEDNISVTTSRINNYHSGSDPRLFWSPW